MANCRITVVKTTFHEDLSNKYENVIEHACLYKEGDVFISKEGKIPDNFCLEAWKSVGEFVNRLISGETNLFDGWMKNPNSAVISCNDGIRPVSFLIELI